MAKKVYRTAQGKVLDLDGLLLVNEESIAVGNMKVNARGDELGPGGKIVKTRAQIMDEYYKLNTPVAQEGNMMPTNITPAEAQATVSTNPGTPPGTPTIHPDHVAAAMSQPSTPEIDAQAAEFEEAIGEQSPASLAHHEVVETTMRGSLASAVAATATVTQEPKLPLNKANGVQRF